MNFFSKGIVSFFCISSGISAFLKEVSVVISSKEIDVGSKCPNICVFDKKIPSWDKLTSM